jgi:hypothetical protein
MPEAFPADRARTPVSTVGGDLRLVRPDDLLALTLNALVATLDAASRTRSRCGATNASSPLGTRVCSKQTPRVFRRAR